MNVGKAVLQLSEWNREVVNNLQLKIPASDGVLVELSQILSSMVRPVSLLQTIMSSNLKVNYILCTLYVVLFGTIPFLYI